MEQTQPKLKVVNGHVYATSLEVAKRFNKSHDNVVKADSEHFRGNTQRLFSRYQDSFDAFLRLRRGSVAKAA